MLKIKRPHKGVVITIAVFLFILVILAAIPRIIPLPLANPRNFQANHRIIIAAANMYKETEGRFPENLSELAELESVYLDELSEPEGSTYEIFVDQDGKLTLRSEYEEEILIHVFE